MIEEFKGTDIEAKALLRLGNIAERRVDIDSAIDYYTQALEMDLTWDQFKYANFNARKLIMTRGQRAARVACGPVALAACLNAIDRSDAADSAGKIEITDEGISLAELQVYCDSYGIQAEAVEMSFDEMKNAKLPVLAYIEAKHFAVILSIDDDKVLLEDSVRGQHVIEIDDLATRWGDKVLLFNQNHAYTQLAFEDSLQTVGGCCGQADEYECLGNPADCQMGSFSSGDGWGDCDTCPNVGRPGWMLNVNI